MNSNDNPTHAGPDLMEHTTLVQRLQQFSDEMRAQTERNWWKGGRESWLAADMDQYLLEAQVNLQELRTALVYGHDVDAKAADVANDAFYLWDAFKSNIGGLKANG